MLKVFLKDGGISPSIYVDLINKVSKSDAKEDIDEAGSQVLKTLNMIKQILEHDKHLSHYTTSINGHEMCFEIEEKIKEIA